MSLHASDINNFFQPEISRPATYRNAAGTVEKDISVLFDDDFSNTQFGGVEVTNTQPATEVDLRKIPAVAKGDRLQLNDYWEDDYGGYITDSNGDPIVINGETNYYIAEIHKDTERMASLVLSKDTV